MLGPLTEKLILLEVMVDYDTVGHFCLDLILKLCGV